jgi:branched-chain amino acid aminotransferase
MIASEPALCRRPEYLYYIITDRWAPTFRRDSTARIYVTMNLRRRAAALAKQTMANYAASLYAAEMAKKKGYTQVLWLDAVERAWVEEVGTMNIFFRIDDQLITPPLSGSILPGITRDSVLELARHWGLPVSERPIKIDEVIATIRSGKMREIFGTGTAAVISPVGEICYKDQLYRVQDGGVGEWSQKFYEEILGIQYGEKKDPFGWIHKVTL